MPITKTASGQVLGPDVPEGYSGMAGVVKAAAMNPNMEPWKAEDEGELAAENADADQG